MDSKSEIVNLETETIDEILFSDLISDENIIDVNTAKVKIEIEDFDFTEKEYDEVISNEPSLFAQKRKMTENENHEIINQKKFKEEFIEFEELDQPENDPTEQPAEEIQPTSIKVSVFFIKKTGLIRPNSFLTNLKFKARFFYFCAFL
jgi:hypothetical protein